MPLSPFRSAVSEFSSSITMDASTVGGTTVTTAVLATRAEEAAILESIYKHGEEIGFKPFYHKANDFEHAELREFAEDLLRSNRVHLNVFRHDHRESNSDSHQVEAVHSAIHVNDFLEQDSDPLVIVDGNEQKATPVLNALSGLRTDLPAVAHCLQSENYYPSALLADVAANHLAHCLDDDESNGTTSRLDVDYAKETRPDDWGKSFNGLYTNSIKYTPVEVPNRRGDSVRERICCWFEGAVMIDSSAPPPMTDSLTPVINALRQAGFDRTATNLEQL